MTAAGAGASGANEGGFMAACARQRALFSRLKARIAPN